MEDYFLAKRRLFDGRARAARWSTSTTPTARAWPRDFPQASRIGLDAPDAQVRATAIEGDASGSSFAVDGLALRTTLPGRFNVAQRARRGRGGARAGRRATRRSRAALAGAERVPGRFEPVDEGQPFAVFVDYAHKPDALEAVLRAARGLARGRLIVVFGAGGDRDRGKRPLMGARRPSTPTWRSSPPTTRAPRTPRRSSPRSPRRAARRGASVERVVDRHAAIERAIALAAPGDVVVVAGKGHERYQEFEDGRTVPFDDVAVAREALRARVVA